MRAGLVFSLFAALAACGPKDIHVEPSAGDGDGGQAVTIVGSDFLGHGPVVVYLGLRSARAVVIEDDRHISAITPEAEAFAPVDVRLEFSDGTVHTLPQAYRYVQVQNKPLKPIPFRPGGTPVPTAE